MRHEGPFKYIDPNAKKGTESKNILAPNKETKTRDSNSSSKGLTEVIDTIENSCNDKNNDCLLNNKTDQKGKEKKFLLKRIKNDEKNVLASNRKNSENSSKIKEAEEKIKNSFNLNNNNSDKKLSIEKSKIPQQPTKINNFEINNNNIPIKMGNNNAEKKFSSNSEKNSSKKVKQISSDTIINENDETKIPSNDLNLKSKNDSSDINPFIKKKSIEENSIFRIHNKKSTDNLKVDLGLNPTNHIT